MLDLACSPPVVGWIQEPRDCSPPRPPPSRLKFDSRMHDPTDGPGGECGGGTGENNEKTHCLVVADADNELH